MEYLSIKDFAAAAGVSTQRIYQRLAKDLQSYCKEENGRKYLSVEGLKLFNKEDLQSTYQELTKGLQSTYQDLATTESILKETLETLREQLAVKDEQLSAKDRQIEQLTAALQAAQEQQRELTAALTAAQALHAGTIQERLTEQREQPESTAEHEPEIIPETEQEQPQPERQAPEDPAELSPEKEKRPSFLDSLKKLFKR